MRPTQQLEINFYHKSRSYYEQIYIVSGFFTTKDLVVEEQFICLPTNIQMYPD